MNLAKINSEYLRSALFGIEDSLVSTTGLIAGLSVGSDNKRLVVLGATIAIIVEAVSMGAGEYLSSDAVQELEKIKRPADKPFISSLLMFGSYFLAGLIPLSPILFLAYPASLITSVLFALFGLFLLGYIKGRLLNTSPWHSSGKILLVGGLATLIGVAAGRIFRI